MRPSRNFIIPICILFLFLSSCEKEIKYDYQLPIPSTWKFIGIQEAGTNILDRKPSGIREMSISFIDSTRLKGVSSCNGYFGHFEIDDSGVMNLETGSNMIHCLDEEVETWESIYYAGLREVIGFEIHENTLAMTTCNGQKLFFKN